MDLKIIGILQDKQAPQSGVSRAGKDWIKQSFIIDTGDKFDNIISFGVFGQDKVNDLNEYNKGDKIEIDFNIKCREYNGKFYTDLDAWRIIRSGEAKATAPADPNADFVFDQNEEEPPF